MRCTSPLPKSALPLLKHLMLVAGICFGTARALAEAIPTLDQFFQALDEACSWRAINDVVINTHRQAQIVANLDAPVHDPRLLGNAAERNFKRMHPERDRPTAASPKHPNGRHT